MLPGLIGQNDHETTSSVTGFAPTREVARVAGYPSDGFSETEKTKRDAWALGSAVYRSATRPTTCSEVQCTGLPLCNPAYPDETFKRALDPWALARATSASLVGEGGAFLQGNGCVPSLPRVGRVAARWTAYPEGGRVGSRTHV